MTVVVLTLGSGVAMGCITVGLPMAVVFGAVGVVAFVEIQANQATKAGIEELEEQVPLLREAVLQYELVHGELPLERGPEPRDVLLLDDQAVAFPLDSAFDDLEWDRPEEVLGTYELLIDGLGDFTVVGLADLDGDAYPVEVVAHRETEMQRLTPDWVH